MNNAAPMSSSSSEADQEQLAKAQAQGEAYGDALHHMVANIAKDGGQQEADHYIVAYAIEDAEGMYHLENGELVWHNPHNENAHVEIVVRDISDGRFVPGLKVTATMVTPVGEQLGPYTQELVWHPMLYHYARNWDLPTDGQYILRVHIDTPTFMRHDEINGLRFPRPVDVEFTDVQIQRGAEPVEPPQS